MKDETLNKIKTDLEEKKELTGSLSDYSESHSVLKLINQIRMAYRKEIEEDNNNIFLYYKSYYYSRTVAEDVISVPYGAKNEDFRRYVNLETGECIDKFKTQWDEFEAGENVVIPETGIYTYDDFVNLRSKFILDAMENGQEKAVQKVLKK